MKDFIKFENVTKTYEVGDVSFNALDGISFSIPKGEFVVILGPSGAGKSTLLNLLGGMDQATRGSIIDGENIEKYNANEMSEYRAENVGFIFQFYNILPTLTVLENVEIVKDIVKKPKSAKRILRDVGLEKHLTKYPNQLSGGEQQRVGLARALVNNPAMIIADEPTGNIDPELSYEIVDLLKEINKCGTTVLMVTHEHNLVKKFPSRVIEINGGKITNDKMFKEYENQLNKSQEVQYESKLN